MNEIVKIEQKKKIKPFIKWAGGKTQMLKSLKPFLKTDYNKYIEPFLGGGAVFFNIQPKKSILSDYNKELITAYRVINGPRKIDKLMNELMINYVPYSNNEEMYYKIRDRELSGNKIKDTARFIYLNKSCFNGLYRVNKSGKFNVPFGKKKNTMVLDPKNLNACMEALKNTKLLCGDFYKTMKYIEKNDLVYLDPPYAPLSKTSDFTDYTDKGFNQFDQMRLKNYCDEITKKGAKFILNNSDVPFINELYNEYNVMHISISRAISAKKESRVKVGEVIITNYGL